MSDNRPSQTAPAAPGLKLGAFDPGAVARAEAALKSLSGNFAQWLADEVAKLEAARQRLRAEGASPAALENLYLRAHDLKGLGGTYEFPLVSRLAASLCKLIDKPAKRACAPIGLIDAHVDAIASVVRNGVRTDADPAGRALALALEDKVAGASGDDALGPRGPKV